MDEAERAFRDALHRVDSVIIPVPLLDAAELSPAPKRRSGLVVGRWLAAAASLALVVGLGVWTLTAREGTVPAVPAAPASSTLATPNRLLGTTWLAVQLYVKPTKASPEKVPFIEFRADSTFYGGDPCNNIAGTYRLDGDELAITRTGAMTEIACNTGQQQRYLNAVDGVRRVVIDGGHLEFLDQQDNVLAVFQSSDDASYTGPTPTPVSHPSIPTTDPDTPTSSPPTTAGAEPVGSVEIRISNTSSVDFTDVYAWFPSGEKIHYGRVPAGSVSGYEAVAQAYSYTYLEVVARGKTYRLQPIDYVGETPLTGGRYAYQLDLVGGRIDLQLVEER